MFSRSVIVSCILSAAAGVTFWSEEYEVQRHPQQLLQQQPEEQLRSTVAPQIKFYSEPAEDNANQNYADSPQVTPYPIYLHSTKSYAVHKKEPQQKYPLQDYIAKNIPQQSKFVVLDQTYPTEAPRPFSLSAPIQRPYVSLNRDHDKTNRTRESLQPNKITKASYVKKQAKYKQKTLKHYSGPYPLVGTPFPVVKKLPFYLTEAKSIPKYIEGKKIFYKYNEEPSIYEEEKHQPYREENPQNNNQLDDQSHKKYQAQQYQGVEQYNPQIAAPYQVGKFIAYRVSNHPIYPVGMPIPYQFQNQYSYQQGIPVPRPVLQRVPYYFQKPLSYEVEENSQEEVQNPMQVSQVRSVPYPIVLPYNVALIVPYNVGSGRTREGPKYQSHLNRVTPSTTISPVFNSLSTSVTPSSQQTVARFYDGHISKYNKQTLHHIDSENVGDPENPEVEQQTLNSRSEHVERTRSRTTQVGRTRSDYRRANKSKN